MRERLVRWLSSEVSRYVTFGQVAIAFHYADKHGGFLVGLYELCGRLVSQVLLFAIAAALTTAWIAIASLTVSSVGENTP